MTLLFEEAYQNGNGKGIGAGGIRSAVKLVKPLFNECLNERIIHYSKKNNKTNRSNVEGGKSDELKVEKLKNEKCKCKQSANKKSGKCKNKTCKKIKKVKKDYLD